MNWTQTFRVILIILIILGFGLTYRHIDTAWNMRITGSACDLDINNPEECMNLMGKQNVSIDQLKKCKCYTSNEMYNYGLRYLFATLFLTSVYMICFGNDKDVD